MSQTSPQSLQEPGYVFSAPSLTHLPTPQSPNNLGQYLPTAPGSPLGHGSSFHSSGTAPVSQPPPALQQYNNSPSWTRQVLTPESSPRHNRFVLPHHNPTSNKQSSAITAPKSTFAEKHRPNSPLSPFCHPSSPLSEPPSSSRLSSPFADISPRAVHKARTRTPDPSHRSYPPEAMAVDDVFAASIFDHGFKNVQTQALQLSPTSPYPQVSYRSPLVAESGELDRIRQAEIEERRLRQREVDTRRPEYLKRAKRPLIEVEPAEETSKTVGIVESPHKGRRLALFQETSEESFEESLMAGGYGRYRTADWVRQPQPLAIPVPSPAGTPNIVTLLEQAEDAPPTERELKKRKRMAAFQDQPPAGRVVSTRLHAVELENEGRVLMEVPPDEPKAVTVAMATTAKKKGGSRRKRKGAESKSAPIEPTPVVEEQIYKPNWPDAEFPWRLRTEERAETARAQEEERLQWIERFLDRSSDDEDAGSTGAVDIDSWTRTEESDGTSPRRGGRGKMVPLSSVADNGKGSKVWYPSDSADARVALLALRNFRAPLARRHRRSSEDGDEVLCICQGRDDGRELVQCDSCETWYHLHCIGINDIAELGKEEDPWFCSRCGNRSAQGPPPDLMETSLNSREPILVPTAEPAQPTHIYDPPFFQPLSAQDSMTWYPPQAPKTPTRSTHSGHPDYDLGSSSTSESSWVNSSRHAPSTPMHSSQEVRVYATHTPVTFGGFDRGYDESPFDPTSTPSRGIKFGAPFITPKDGVWAGRTHPLFHTPSRPNGRSSLGGMSSFGDNGVVFGSFARLPAYDDSPSRKPKGVDPPPARHVSPSPMMSRPVSSLAPPNTPEDSPSARAKGKDRLHKSGPGR